MVEIEVMLTVGQTLSAVGYLAGREGGKVTIGQVRTEERKGDREREREIVLGLSQESGTTHQDGR